MWLGFTIALTIIGAVVTANVGHITNAVNAGVYYFNNAIGGGSDEE